MAPLVHSASSRSAGCTCVPSCVARAAAAAALCGVYFLQPLVVEAANLLVECAVSDGRFEVRSGEADAIETAQTVHLSLIHI